MVRSLDEIEGPACIAGGAQVYREALEKPGFIDTVHLSLISGRYPADIFFDVRSFRRDFVIVNEEGFVGGASGDPDFVHYTLKRCTNGEGQYLTLLARLLEYGIHRESRSGDTVASFVNHFEFDLRDGFPLLTTKRVSWRNIVEEFLFFIRGDTDTSALSAQKVRIWEGNTSSAFLRTRGLTYAEGVMGPMYGYQWRHYGAPYRTNSEGKPLEPEGGIDQLERVIQLIKTDPHSRRILMTVYNPPQAEEGVLAPCHSIAIQFFVDGDCLDMFCFNRSQDLFLGVPYNIASSSLLLSLVAKLTKKTPRFLKMSMGDTHLYSTHKEAAEKQLGRLPYSFPLLEIVESFEELDQIPTLTLGDFTLHGYKSHPGIRAPMSI